MHREYTTYKTNVGFYKHETDYSLVTLDIALGVLVLFKNGYCTQVHACRSIYDRYSYLGISGGLSLRMVERDRFQSVRMGYSRTGSLGVWSIFSYSYLGIPLYFQEILDVFGC